MVKIIKPEEYKTSQWSGGTTTEMFIYPSDTSYSDRNFQFRISAATITDPRSVFTKLDGVSRILCLMKGQLTLHINGSVYPMEPYDICRFDGSRDTTGTGIAEDLNLMFREGEGEVQVLYAARPVIVKTNCNHQFFFSREQDFFVTAGGIGYKLDKGELLYLYDEKDIIKIRPESEGRNPLIHITCKIKA